MTIKEERASLRSFSLPLGMLLLFLATSLLLVTAPIGFLYSCCFRLIDRSAKRLGYFFLEVAVSIDQLGNVIMADLLNALFIRNKGYRFGNRDETISSVLGKNLKMNTLSQTGKWITQLLDRIDKGHSLNSIDYFVQPDESIEKKYTGK